MSPSPLLAFRVRDVSDDMVVSDILTLASFDDPSTVNVSVVANALVLIAARNCEKFNDSNDLLSVVKSRSTP